MTSYVEGPPREGIVVEDNSVEASILSAKLRRLNCESTVAKNGKEAVNFFLEGKKFKIVFCDKDMPVMTGPKAVEKIRAFGETDVKIVGVSTDVNAQEAFMSAGADVFVPKPLNLDILRAMIQEVINKKNNSMV